jgi:hypothetical protein
VDVIANFKESTGLKRVEDQDGNYYLLCQLNFEHQTTFFDSLLVSSKRFFSFIIRGPQANYGQRWLANRLIQLYVKGKSMHEPLCFNFSATNLLLDSFMEQMARPLQIVFPQTSGLLDKRALLKNGLVKRIESKPQFIVLVNAYAFIHSAEYNEFLEMIKYFSIEFNNSGNANKCVFLLVEEEVSERYSHKEDCVFSEDIPLIEARKMNGFRFVDLGMTTPLNAKDVNTWLAKSLNEEQLYCFNKQQQNDENMIEFLGDGNPQRVIPDICKELNIDYLENEKKWLKY